MAFKWSRYLILLSFLKKVLGKNLIQIFKLQKINQSTISCPIVQINYKISYNKRIHHNKLIMQFQNIHKSQMKLSSLRIGVSKNK